MLKKTITFKDLDDNEVTQDFYFNLSKVELTEMEHSMIGGISEHWTKLIDDRNTGGIIAAYKQIIGTAVGRRSDDGIAFLKSDEITQRFLHSNAYEVLFIEHFGEHADDEAFFDFLKSVVPKEALDNMPQTVSLSSVAPSGERTLEQHSREELLKMSQEDFDKLAGTDSSKWSKELLQIAFQRKGSQQS